MQSCTHIAGPALLILTQKIGSVGSSNNLIPSLPTRAEVSNKSAFRIQTVGYYAQIS